jgi:glucose-1-phosphate adenylyltransferase
MDHCKIQRGARLRRTIVDRYNRIEAGDRIGFDAEADRARYHVTDAGVTVVPMGAVPAHANLYE